jgi:hypothetical protein
MADSSAVTVLHSTSGRENDGQPRKNDESYIYRLSIDVTLPHFSIAFVSGNDHGDKVGRVCLFASTKGLLSGHLSTSNVTFGFDDLRS